MTTPNQKRILLWAAPRSMSTAFYHAITSTPGIHGIFEPYTYAFYFGDERQSKRYLHQEPKHGFTYLDVRRNLEQEFPNADIVFAKDMSYNIINSPQNPVNVLPDGYLHTFLIRDPRRTITSLYKMSIATKDKGWGYFDSKEAGFKDLYMLYMLVSETLKQKTIIIDADDLLKTPSAMLRAYCDVCGIQYNDAMIAWHGNSIELQNTGMFKTTDWHSTVSSTSSFLNPNDVRPIDDINKMDPEVRTAINDQMPYYKELNRRRHVIEI